jgi:hypothetical protein
MGSGRWDDSKWSSYAATNNYEAKKDAKEIYKAREIKKGLDPKGVKIRESCDSKDNPNSTAVIVALDVTGSMDAVLHSMATKGLKILMSSIYERKPVSDPHVMVMGIGDVEAGDSAPLQATQFEADIRIAEQLEDLFLEGGGGGNRYESYALAWYFAAHHTKIDCFEKHKRKGFLFTIGDEEPTPYLRREDLDRVFGGKSHEDVKIPSLLTQVSKQWEVFHLIVEEGNHARAYPKEVSGKWKELLGQHVLQLADHTKMAEVIVSTLQINQGISHDKVLKSWDKKTAEVVERATQALAKKVASNEGLARL